MTRKTVRKMTTVQKIVSLENLVYWLNEIKLKLRNKK
jgi:hypothetical protein